MDYRAPRTGCPPRRATDGALFIVLSGMLDAKLDPHVVVDRRLPTYVVVVLGLLGDEVCAEHELLIETAGLAERFRLGLLLAFVQQREAKHRRFVVMVNPKLLALGVRPIELPR